MPGLYFPMRSFQKSRLYSFVFLSSLLSAPLAAQTTGSAWTLQQCVDYALKNNIQIRQSQLNAEISKENFVQSQASALPSLNGNVSHSYNFGRTIDPFTNTFATDKVLSQNFYLSSSVTLFSGFQTYNTIRQNKMVYLASQYDITKTTNDISLGIASAYLQVLFAQELRNIARSQAEVTLKQVERTRKLLEAGSVAKGTLLDIQSQLAAEELNFTNAQNQLDIATLSLVQLLNLEKAEGFSIVKPDLADPSESLLGASPSQVYSTAVQRQPEIKSAEYRLLSSERGLSAARGGMSPRISLSGSYGTGYSGASKRIAGSPAFNFAPNGDFTSGGDTVYSAFLTNGFEVIPFSDQVNDNINKNIGLHLTVPLFNGLQTKSAMSRAKLQKQISELSLQQAKNDLNKAIQQAHADATAALKKYGATKKAAEAMQEAFKYTEQKFNVGMLNSNDYNDAKNKLQKAESDLLSAKYDYIFKVKVLDFYQGKPLSF